MIARAEKCCDFASDFGEYDILYRRAVSDRPYNIIVTLYFKLQFILAFSGKFSEVYEEFTTIH